jgi:hypothetical protein
MCMISIVTLKSLAWDTSPVVTEGQPKTVFDALRSWLENDTAPDTLPIEFNGKDGSQQEHILCPYPSKAVYQSGNSSSAESFGCVDREKEMLS